MELLPRGESNKRKLEEEELVPPGLEDIVLKPCPESKESEDYSITKLDDIRKEGELEILQRPKRVFGDYYEEEDDGSGTPVSRPLREDELVDSPCLGSNIVSDYRQILTEYTTTDEGRILQSARVVFDKKLDVERRVGHNIVAMCFRDYESYFSSDYFRGGADVDAEFLKSCLSHYLEAIPEDLGRELGLFPDWEELAKYVNQLRKTEGFDLDDYHHLGDFTPNLPKRPCDRHLRRFHHKKIAKCIKEAMKLYMEAGGAELKEEKLVKANVTEESSYTTFYITFTAKSCVDGKERHYQAQVSYDELDKQVAADRNIMVRLKKEPTD